MLKEVIEDTDIVYISQLFIGRDCSRQRFSEWKRDFSEYNEISDTIKRIEDILESRLVVGGLRNKLNPTMVIFTLKNKYNWSNNESLPTLNAYSDVAKEGLKKYFS